MPERPLTAKERAFCERYPVSLNATLAATEAGYAARSAKQRGSYLLARPAIQAEIAVQMEARARRTHVEADRVLEELALVAFSDIDHYSVDVQTGRVTLADGAPKGAKRAIASVKFRVKDGACTTELRFWDKNAAIGNAMKHLGMLNDRLELTGKNGGPIAHAVTVRFVRAATSEGS